MLINIKENLLTENVVKKMTIIKDFQHCIALLGWDQETKMPIGSWEARADQICTLEEISHKILTDDDSKRLVDKIKNNKCDKSSLQNRLLCLYVKDYENASKLNNDFIIRYSKAKSQSLESWRNAKKHNNFNFFENDFTTLIELTIEKAELLGCTRNKYDALLDEFEEGMTYNKLLPIFENIELKTKKLTSQIAKSHNKIKSINPKLEFYEKVQFKFAKKIAKKLAFDFQKGRLDKSIHPFTTSFSQKDVRITTRIDKNNIFSCLYGTIHEVGHGLYEQGIDLSLYRTFASDATSLGIHESQSLIWENIICRTQEFWEWVMPELKNHFHNELKGYDEKDMYEMVNKVENSFIRTEADELTYNLHILIRTDIENKLINSKIKPKDLPDIWNELYKKHLGLIPKNDNIGCLQDIHWAAGMFGYFPTYTLGKLYASTIWEEMNIQIPHLKSIIKEGEFFIIRKWLKENIHTFGRLKSPEEIIFDISGKSLNTEDFFSYLEKKLKHVYEI
jgi:carboxypeptidase Taq